MQPHSVNTDNSDLYGAYYSTISSQNCFSMAVSKLEADNKKFCMLSRAAECITYHFNK